MSRRADSEENDRQGTKHNGLRDRNFQKGEKGEVGGWRMEREEGRKSYLKGEALRKLLGEKGQRYTSVRVRKMKKEKEGEKEASAQM